MRRTSIVILSYNTVDYLMACIESIRLFTPKNSYEIIVVENASKDGSAEWLKQQKDIRCIYNNENMGFPKGCNQGIEIATGDNILLLNSDVIVTPRWLEQLKTALYSSDDIGAVSCITNSASNWQGIKVEYNSIDEMLEFAEAYNHSNSAKWYSYYTLVGFCFLFRSSLVKEIGYLDEAFSPGNYEDDDYSFRIRKAGYRLFLCEDTFVHHYGSMSFVKKRTLEEEKEHAKKYNELLKKNKKYFCRKWNIKEDYKKSHIPIEQFHNVFGETDKVLFLGNCMAQTILLVSRLIPNTTITYLSDDKIEYELLNKDINITYTKNLFNDIKKIKEKYNVILVGNDLVKKYSVKKVLDILQKNTKTGKIMIQN